MGDSPLAAVLENLKQLRRQGRLSAESLGEIVEQEVPHEFAGRSVDPAEIIRVLEIKSLADRIFGDRRKAEAWLARPNAALASQRPLDLLQDELGAAIVREMLERIDHGIFA